MDRARLPRYTTGTEYYWLGVTPQQAISRLPGAIQNMNLDVSSIPIDPKLLDPAFHGQRVGISGDWNAPGAGGPKMGPPSTAQPAPTYPGAQYPQGPLGVLTAISETADFLKWIAWLFHPLNLLRAVEFITGLATMFYGLNTLMGVMRRGSATHRTTIRSLFNWTPMGKARQISRARSRGRRAGQVQAERDVAYRGARQERARQVGAGRRTTPGSGTGGTGQGSSALE
jgi:hypothetical protein